MILLVNANVSKKMGLRANFPSLPPISLRKLYRPETYKTRRSLTTPLQKVSSSDDPRQNVGKLNYIYMFPNPLFLVPPIAHEPPSSANSNPRPKSNSRDDNSVPAQFPKHARGREAPGSRKGENCFHFFFLFSVNRYNLQEDCLGFASGVDPFRPIGSRFVGPRLIG